MQITGGSMRGRKLLSPKDTKIRPSASRTREAAFNLLLHAPAPEGLNSCIRGQRVADICCGSGLLGFEALSRGAERVTFVDASRESLALARANAEHLGVANKVDFLQVDAARLPTARLPYAAILADPPYREGLSEPLLKAIMAGGWLIQGGYVALETAAKEPLPEVDGLTLYKDRDYSAARLAVFVREG